MVTSVDRPVLVLRPRRGAVTLALGIAGSFALIPPFIALYLLTASDGDWIIVLVVHVLLAGLLTLAGVRVHLARAEVSGTTLRLYSYFNRRVVLPLDEIASILRLQVLTPASTEFYPQLFLLDANGRTLARLRGQQWETRALDALVDALPPVPTNAPELPITMSEMRHAYRANLSSWERHPVITSIAVAAAVVVIAAPLFAVLNDLVT